MTARELTPTLLQAALGCSAALADAYAVHLAEACERYSIGSPARLAMFLAQIGHESGGLRYTAEIWGPTPAQARYEGRADLGNTRPGDGERYRGHGLIQITGRYNHARATSALAGLGCPDFEAEPQRLAEPRWAALSAAWYWQSHGCNELADAGDFEGVTRRINGGLNGLADRRQRWQRAQTALAAAPESPVPTPQPAPVRKEEPMLPIVPILNAILPSLTAAIPALGKLFGSDSGVSERNVKAVTLAADIVQQAVGATNAQEAAERVVSDPGAAQAARDAIAARWLDLTEAGGGGIAGAREHDVQVVERIGGFWRSPSFAATVILAPLVYMVVGSIAGLWGYAAWSDDVRAAIATAVVSLIVGGAAGFYWGSTTGSRKGPTQ